MARDLRITLDRAFFQFAEHTDIRDFEVFNQAIPTFAASERLHFDLARGSDLGVTRADNLITPTEIGFDLSYNSDTGRTYHDKLLIDFKPYMHSHHPRSVAEHLENIEKHLQTMSRQR